MSKGAEAEKTYFDAPYKPSIGINAEQEKANALTYIAAHIGRISVSLKDIEERMASQEKQARYDRGLG